MIFFQYVNTTYNTTEKANWVLSTHVVWVVFQIPVWDWKVMEEASLRRNHHPPSIEPVDLKFCFQETRWSYLGNRGDRNVFCTIFSNDCQRTTRTLTHVTNIKDSNTIFTHRFRENLSIIKFYVIFIGSEFIRQWYSYHKPLTGPYSRANV